MRRLWVFLVVLFGVITLDQLSKWWALRHLWPDGRVMTVVPGWLIFIPVENRGVAFGLFRDYGMALAVMVILLLAVIALRNWRSFIVSPPLVKMAVGMIGGGGIGNLIDRMRLGFVVDFIHIPALALFQVFNIADASISVGGVLLITSLWWAERHDRAGMVTARSETEEPVRDIDEATS